MTETLLDGLIGAGVGAVVAAIPAFIALKRSRQSNDLAKEANEIAKTALEETRLATHRARQYKLLDDTRVVLNELSPLLDAIARDMTRAIHVDNTEYDIFAEQCGRNTDAIEEHLRRIRALEAKLNDVNLLDHLGGIDYGLEHLQPALRESYQHALTIAKLAQSNAAYGADRPAVVLLQESADKAGEWSVETAGAVEFALKRLDVLERDGLK
jgi:hypothetical protein